MSDMKSSKIILTVCAMVLMLSCFAVGHSNASVEVLWTQTFNPSNGVDRPISVALDSSGVYVVGFDNVPGNDEWRIEKRSLTDGALLWAQTTNPSDGDDWAAGVALDSSGVYVVGFDNVPGNDEWRIEKRSLTDGALLWIDRLALRWTLREYM
jgi:hypothetical protein